MYYLCYTAPIDEDIPYDNVENNDGDDDSAFDIVMDSKGQRSHGDEDGSQSVCNLLQEDVPEGDALGA